MALDALGDNCGAVVALDPRTGKVRAMVSSPSFDPNLVETDFASLDAITANCTPASPLLNRASAGLYVPGSTFKVITASAALESKKFTPGSLFEDPGYCTVYGKHVNNFDTTSPFGTINLEDALTYSVNSVFCNIGLKLGAKRILDTAKRFGFYELPPLETPADERRASGLYQGRQALLPEGRLGRRRRPHGVRPGANARDAPADGDGRRRDRRRRQADGAAGRRPHRLPRREDDRQGAPEAHPPRRQPRHRECRREDDAARRRARDRHRRADPRLLGRRQDRARARPGVPGSNTTWFIAFAGPDDESPAELAVAVVLQNQSGTGGTTAAPIARDVMEAILRSAENP